MPKVSVKPALVPVRRIFISCSRKDFRYVRGGGWNNNPDNARSANRNRNAPDNRNNNIGFRLARTLEGLKQDLLSMVRTPGFKEQGGALPRVQGWCCERCARCLP